MGLKKKGTPEPIKIIKESDLPKPKEEKKPKKD